MRIFLKGPRPAKPSYKPSFLHFHFYFCFENFEKSWVRDQAMLFLGDGDGGGMGGGDGGWDKWNNRGDITNRS